MCAKVYKLKELQTPKTDVNSVEVEIFNELTTISVNTLQRINDEISRIDNKISILEKEKADWEAEKALIQAEANKYELN